MSHQVTTQDHSRIRKWVEARDGRPSTVKGTERDRDPAGVLRIDFPGYGEDENLEHICWEDWFAKFDENDLVMVMQEEESDEDVNRFNKIVSKESLDAKSRNA